MFDYLNNYPNVVKSLPRVIRVLDFSGRNE
jgi:hypothetical protein